MPQATLTIPPALLNSKPRATSAAAPQVEVAALAAATLAGMLKGMAPAEAAGLRAKLLDRAAALFGSRRRRRTGAAAAPPAAPPISEQTACVQGLKAFVLSAPYDCPPWMGKVLLALASAAGAGAPPSVRREAAAVLSEFRRTHEQDAMGVLREQLEEDEWDAVAHVTSGASYFV